MSVLIEHFAAATAALMAGRREGGVMADAPGDRNRGPRPPGYPPVRTGPGPLELEIAGLAFSGERPSNRFSQSMMVSLPCLAAIRSMVFWDAASSPLRPVIKARR